MGLDFIRSTAVSHMKAWRIAFENAQTDLFASSCTLSDRVFIAVLTGQAAIEEQQSILVRLVNDRVYVYDGIEEIAQIENPSPELLEHLSTSFGVINGEIDEIHDFTHTLSVSIGGNGR